LSGRSLLLHNVGDPENPIELAFQVKYGKIMVHHAMGGDYMLIGFSEGFLVVISTQMSEIGEEQFSGRFHSSSLVDLTFSTVLKRAATAGQGGVKVRSLIQLFCVTPEYPEHLPYIIGTPAPMTPSPPPPPLQVVDLTTYKEMKEESIPFEQGEGKIDTLSWSPDGQILTVSNDAGSVFNFLAHIPAVHASCGSRLVYLSSLREVSVVDASSPTEKPQMVSVDIEPTFVALGPGHVAVGMNDRVLYYRLGHRHGQQVDEREYNGQVVDLHLNSSYAAVLSSSHVILQPIEPGLSLPGAMGSSSKIQGPRGGGAEGAGAATMDGAAPGQRKTFPERDDGPHGKAKSVALTESFLIYGTQAGTLEFFCLLEWGMLAGSELRHLSGVVRLWPNFLGTRVAFADASHAGWVYSPAANKLTQASPG
ncbi:unnamed protein product, partial [Discosporangium mesarthrocarpum]